MNLLRHKQLFTLIASLVLLLAQFASLAHATEHPFHADEPLCIVYQNAEQNKQLLPVSCDAGIYIIPGYQVVADTVNNLATATSVYYSSRAPPAQTV